MCFTLATVIFSMSIQSCFDNETQDEIEEKQIKEYIDENDLDLIKDENGIYYTINNPEVGEHPKDTSEITVKYKGYFLDGEVFDETDNDKTFKSPLDLLIEGWQIAVPKLKQGGKGTFILPSYYTYRDGKVRVFDIELISFE